MSSGSFPLFRVIGFSGHRQIAAPDAIAAVIRRELEALRRSSPEEWIALSSAAEGGDQLFVAQARALSLSWHAVLPLPRAEFARDFASGDWPEVEALLAAAEDIRVISEDGPREDAYLDCGIETVNGADVLLAVWDGEPARGKGGTADVVAYARSLGRPLLIIDAVSHEVRRENFDQLVQADSGFASLNQLPGTPAGGGENPFQAPVEIVTFQQRCDVAATRGAPRVRKLIVATVMLHVAATLIAAAGLAFELHLGFMPWLKLLCLVGALGVALLLRYYHVQHHWMRCRLAAEFCRSALAIWGLPRATRLFEELDFSAQRSLMRSLHILHRRSAKREPMAVEDFKRIYLERRIDDQLAYYRRQEARALPLFGRLKAGFWITTVLALLATLAYAISHSLHWEAAPALVTVGFYFLPIALPVIAASLISFISINDLQRRVARYREMQVLLEESRTRLRFGQTWNSVERVVLKTERALLQEVLEWHSLTSFTESH